MAAATVGISLMKDDLSKVAETIHLGRRTLRIIQFNSLSRSNLFLILSVPGHTSLWLAILADTGGSSTFSVSRAIAMLLYRRSHINEWTYS